MSYLRHIAACNAHDIGRYVRFRVSGQGVGWVRRDLAERLEGFHGVFRVDADGVAMVPALVDFAARSDALARVLRVLQSESRLDALRGEMYGVAVGWGQAPLLQIDRAAAPLFGVGSYGLHVNGYVRRDDGIHMWIGRRADDRAIAPGKLDNLVAGGQPIGLTLQENLLKEAQEEASLPPELAKRAVPVGAVSYCLENDRGLKPDTLFLYDLDLPEGFAPRNADGEVAEFRLLPLAEVARIVRETDEFKFNCNLVVIDFLVRHGALGPDEPDYLEIVNGLRGRVCAKAAGAC